MTSPIPFLRRALPWLSAAAALAALAVAARAPDPAPPPATLRVGVAPGALPVSTGERDYTSGGFEAVYAKELAQRLGAALTLVPLAPEAQAAALQRGEVDLVLGRGDADAATGIATGYRSGLGVSMRADTPVRRWEDLRGRVVCTSADNRAAQARAERLGARLRVLAAPAQALVQVRTGGCDAALLDHAQLAPLLSQKEWAKFAAGLPATAPDALWLRLSPARAALDVPVRAAVAALDDPPQWARRRQTWASNVAFEVYFDQTGPDCH
ncbi:MAG: transporter substrate-binding domain-containing protein [Hydrogenophaga sp.]|uniref:transporter substrate-binding domain-containing protein n=1 Tax=Hydrogenophaga sp. TaxID=1904254 RepID=UPI00257A8FBD|nr:transporter substrate-binding domain-containing protein [Hydrogenophaga sp.]MBL0943892.1 transporter substrate-binding domain-containing protein [Hydrogenophaga sp.]